MFLNIKAELREILENFYFETQVKYNNCSYYFLIQLFSAYTFYIKRSHRPKHVTFFKTFYVTLKM